MQSKYYKSRAEFLNDVYHTKFKQHPQAIWSKPDGSKDVWMVRMDGKVHEDWKNTRYDNTIVEEYVGNDMKKLEQNKKTGIIRVAVCIVDSPEYPTYSRYEILGTYELDLQHSNLSRCRVWKKISDKM